MAGMGVGPGWASGLVYLSRDAKTMRGGNAGACGGQRIDVWELRAAAWMAKGQEMHSLMKPTYDSLLHSTTPSTISSSHFFLFSSSVVTSLLSSCFSSPLLLALRLCNLFLSSFSLSSLSPSDLRLLVTKSQGLHFLPANTHLIPPTPTRSRAHAHARFPT